MRKLRKLLAVLVCAAMAMALAPGLTVCAAETADGLEYEVYDDNVEITGYTGNAAVLEIPDEIEGLPVTVIGANAFEYCESLTSVTIPDSVEHIRNDAFYNCSGLENINISDRAMVIEANAFGETAFEQNNDNWADGVLYIGNHLIWAWGGNSDDYAYEIRPGTADIAYCAFQGCSGLTSITIPDSVALIGDFAFSGCTGLTTVNIPDGPGGMNIGYCAFEGCTSLVSATIGGSGIGDSAFEGCTSLTTVNILDSMMRIGVFAFGGCERLEDVYYGGSENQWKKIFIIYKHNDELSKATIHYNSTKPSTEPSEIKVIVNGNKIAFDVPPIILDGTTMLPVRMALEPLGAEFVWDGEARTVTITAKGKTVVLTVDSDVATVDGAAKTMLKPAMIMDGRTLIPIRFVAEALDYEVGWDGDTKTVTIDAK